MRKSLQDIAHLVKPVPYHRALPEELKHFHVYLTDGGHVLMAIPLCNAPQAFATNGDESDYEVGIPVKFVLEKGYDIRNGYLIVDAPYDWDGFGLEVDEQYEEY